MKKVKRIAATAIHRVVVVFMCISPDGKSPSFIETGAAFAAEVKAL
jgi:hypothetical protein